MTPAGWSVRWPAWTRIGCLVARRTGLLPGVHARADLLAGGRRAGAGGVAGATCCWATPGSPVA